jgi:AraC-like DNA-binding protein/anti-sigma regulatory factor (Ser/Thr protein kinase)
VPTYLPQIVVDSVRLRNTLMNLLDNAAKFTRHGQIVLGADYTDTQLHVWVQDTGPGMPLEIVNQIRRSMFLGAAAIGTRTPDSPLPGLGLSISQHLVAQHGGNFQIESVQGRGTTCHIYLPVPVLAPAATDREPEHLVANGAPGAWPGVSSDQIVKKTYAYIAEHYANPFTREEIARTLGVSPSYVTRVFRRQTGLALWDYVNSFRVARACDLLEHSDMTVTEIAFAVGYNDPAYFSRVFRKETGKAPTRYRSAE